jgi:formate--tetrahydrofolate ligase
MIIESNISDHSSMIHINNIAEKAGINPDYLELYGKYKAKIGLELYEKVKTQKQGKLIYVTCITPTPAGEGKTLTSIGLSEAFGKLKKNVILCLREPSLGPTFGTKGGATGAGKAQLLPAEDINLHFTGDLHAITSAHNLLASIIDNHIFRGNEIDINVNRARWRRVVDMNDRVLRDLIVDANPELYGKIGFDITASSEIMAIMALSNSIHELKKKLSNIIVGFTTKGRPIRAAEFHVIDAMALLLKDALKPNLVQTSEGQPAFVHCGPFANIAHGNNSVIATKMALGLGDYVITEGGFSSDLGAEKFFDIICPTQNLKPDIAVLVCSVRALNMHGGASKKEYVNKDLYCLDKGLKHLKAHIDILTKFGLPIVVAINQFDTDSQEEINLIEGFCRSHGVRVAVSKAFAEGGSGAIGLAEEVIHSLENDQNNFKPLYDHNLPVHKKIEVLATEVYGANGVEYTSGARQDLEDIIYSGFAGLPVCMAKTQFSLSDNSSLKGVPKDWILNIRQVKVSNGAGFLVPISGSVMLMPGLPKKPSAHDIHINDAGQATGLR